MAWSLTDQDQQMQARGAIAMAVAARSPDRAEAMARSITNPDQQAEARANIAMKAQPCRARSLIASALRVGRFEASLTALASIDATVISVIADEFLHRVANYPTARPLGR